jgi:hypothetical protein
MPKIRYVFFNFLKNDSLFPKGETLAHTHPTTVCSSGNILNK